MAATGNIPVQCPICKNLIVVPVTAKLVLPENRYGATVEVAVDDDHWDKRLKIHIEKYHG